MEHVNKSSNIVNKHHTERIHRALAHSYSVYLILFLCGAFLNIFAPINIFKNEVTAPLGLTILILASLLIIWAQKTSRNLRKSTVTKNSFLRGPYKFSRSPTHWGLFLLIVGFGIIANSFFVILSACVSFIVTRLTFLKKEESILAEKYGAPYLEYKEEIDL